MYTYSIHAHKTSGERFVIEWDGGDIHAVCGPLDPHEYKQAVQDIAYAASFEYEEYDGDGSDWSSPFASYDPNTDEVWRTDD